jgi:hypothetical protein
MDFYTGLAEIEASTYDEPPPKNRAEAIWRWLVSDQSQRIRLRHSYLFDRCEVGVWSINHVELVLCRGSCYGVQRLYSSGTNTITIIICRAFLGTNFTRGGCERSTRDV